MEREASTTSTCTITVLRLRSTGKEAMIPWRLNWCPSKAFEKVGDGTNSREPKYCQQDNDMTDVEAPSSIMVQHICVPIEAT